MARADAFFAKSGRRPDILTISVRFFDENSIGFCERLLDDRRSLDDILIAPARMRDVEKTLKNLDRAHKIRVRRCLASPRSRTVWPANYFENALKNRTQDGKEQRSKNRAKIEALDPRKSTIGRPWEPRASKFERQNGQVERQSALEVPSGLPKIYK